MLIDLYFQQVNNLTVQFEIIKEYQFNYEKRGLYEGFIRGNLIFKNNSCLYVREFVYVEVAIDRKMYSYQYMDAENNLIFRYDNAEHHRKLNLANFPHHKHDHSENTVITSSAPFLWEVIKEISDISN